MDKDQLEAKKAVAQLPLGKKIAYYVGYYKIHAAVVVALLIAIGLFIRTQVNYETKLMYFGVLNGSAIEEDYLREQMLKQLGTGKKETIVVYTGLTTEAEYSSEGGYNLLSLYMATDQMDIVFSDADGVTYLAKSGAIADPEIWATEDLKALWKNQVYECEALEEEASIDDPTYAVMPVGYDIAGSQLMDDLGLEENCHYMVACYSSGRLEAIQGFCRYVCEHE